MTITFNKSQSLLIVSFGGPEKREDVIPFLKNVLRGKNVPEARMMEVAEHYFHFDGVSPINAQNRQLIAALKQEFASHGMDVPIYFGNRNWVPTIGDALAKMQSDGIRSSFAFFTSAFSSYSGCRQYRENILEAQQALGENAPEVHKLRMFFNHPLFIAAASDCLRDALLEIPESRRKAAFVVFTAHSIPMAMAEGCNYVNQLSETSRLVADQLGARHWELVYQSRSGPPGQEWLEPDVCDYLAKLKGDGVSDVVVMPVGFLSDHMEVLFDLDVEAKQACDRLGLNMVRAKTVGVHPSFVAMIRELVVERASGLEKQAVGYLPPSHDVCPNNCCLLR